MNRAALLEPAEGPHPAPVSQDVPGGVEGVFPSGASRVFFANFIPGGGDDGERQTPGGSEAPGGARSPCRPDTRHKWFAEGGRSAAARAKRSPCFWKSPFLGPVSLVPPSLPLCRREE